MPGVLLHIGTGKTGTSAIQSFAWAQREALAREGIAYPEPGLSHIEHFGELIPAHYPLADWLRRGDERRLQAWAQALRSERAEWLLLSCENLYHHLDAAAIDRLRQLLDGWPVRVVCYARPQDDYIVSAWKQQVKVGDLKGPFGNLLARHLSPDFLAQSHAHHHRMLAPWRAAFGQEAVRLGVFERHHLSAGGGLVADFFRTAGRPLPASLTEQAPPVRNDALPTELLLLLRLANLREAVPAAERPAFIAQLRQLHAFGNPELLGRRQRQAVLDNYREANTRLFAEYAHTAVPERFLRVPTDQYPEEAVLPKVEDLLLDCLVKACRAAPPAADPASEAAPDLPWWRQLMRRP